MIAITAPRAGPVMAYDQVIEHIANRICGSVRKGSFDRRADRPLRASRKKPNAPPRLNTVSALDSARSISPSITSPCCTSANSRYSTSGINAIEVRTRSGPPGPAWHRRRVHPVIF